MFICHGAMLPYLQDLQERFGIPLRYRRWGSCAAERLPFQPEVEVVGPRTTLKSPFALPFQGAEYVVDVVNQRPDRGTPIDILMNGTRYTLAAVDGRRVVLAFDLEHLFEAPVEGIQPGLILEAVLLGGITQAAAFVRGYSWEAERQAFVQWSLTSVQEQLAAWRSSIRENERELDRAAAHMALLVRKNSDLRTSIFAVQEQTLEEQSAASTEEFAGLLKMMPEPVEQIWLDGDRLKVTLQPMNLEYGDDTYRMGRYNLAITADQVRITCDSGRTYPHPHVSSEGVPCWGNLATPVATMLGQRAYASLIATTVQFLGSYNARDAYRRIEAWAREPDSED